MGTNKYMRRVMRGGWVRLSVAILVIAVVFGAGVAVGNGTVQVHLFAFTRTENPTLPDRLDYSSVTQVYQSLRQNYDGTVTATQLLDGLKEGLAQATGDPYTEYFNPQAAKIFADQLDNSFSGIGAELGKDDSGNLIIIAPIKGFPADKAGLKAQDMITAINGVSTSGIATDVAAADIRGAKGTQVTLKVVRNHTENLTFTITRDNIQLPSVTSKILTSNIGYMEISSFSDDTARLAQQAAATFTKAHVKGVILDLRGNPGGLLDAAVNVSSLWLPTNATVVTEKGTVGTQTFYGTGNNPLLGIPTVVLIDGGSASASEITAGALHDNKAATLIGVKSYGKGVVQQLIHFGDGSELKVTVASWYRPNGQNINKKGILPDQTVASSNGTGTATDAGDAQLTAAEAYLTK